MAESKETFRDKVERLLGDGWYRLYLNLLLRHGKASADDVKFVNDLYRKAYPDG